MNDFVDLNSREPATEWTVYEGRNFTVQVRAWRRSDDWNWNVYALIFDGHPFHQNVDAALGLHFHGGPTYDKRIVTSPAQGVKYDWQKVSDCLKIGSDYQHYQDCNGSDDPKDGIPGNIKWDAAVLAKELLDIETGAA